MKIIIPRLPSLNEHIGNAKRTAFVSGRKVRYRKDAIKADYTFLCAHAFKIQGKGIKIDSAYFHFVWFEPNKKKDPDNVVFAKKYIFDGMIKSGLINNDGWRNIAGFHDSWRIDANKPRVEVNIFNNASDYVSSINRIEFIKVTHEEQ